ncbi:MAG: alpha/beta hydrolase [Bacteroidales bacterium]
MKRINIFFLMLLVSTFSLSAQTIIKLYPNGVPDSNGCSGPIVKDSTNIDEVWVKNISDPFMKLYLPKKQTQNKVILICPGGGYSILSVAHEGKEVAQWYNDHGYPAAVLYSRLPNKGHYKIPLEDTQTAIKLLREHNKDWKINADTLGIMGFSAGGHLAATALTLYNSNEDRPDFGVLFYPVITMTASTHGGSKTNLLGETPSPTLLWKYSAEKHVTAYTPQTIIISANDDNVVPIKNSLMFYEALHDNNINSELHIFTHGGHGWAFKDSFPFEKEAEEATLKFIADLK